MMIVKDECGNKDIDFISEISEQLEGKFVVTRYNNMTYRISRIDFSLTPKDKFLYKDTEISYIDYLKTRYNDEIKDHSQPLLFIECPKNREQPLYLVPETCKMIGLTDKLMNTMSVMRDVRSIMRTDAPVRVKECATLFKTLSSIDKCLQLEKDFPFKISEVPTKIKGAKLEPGHLLMGTKRDSNSIIDIHIESCGRDIERQINQKMFS
jgi:hypothetical protein